MLEVFGATSLKSYLLSDASQSAESEALCMLSRTRWMRVPKRLPWRHASAAVLSRVVPRSVRRWSRARVSVAARRRRRPSGAPFIASAQLSA